MLLLLFVCLLVSCFVLFWGMGGGCSVLFLLDILLVVSTAAAFSKHETVFLSSCFVLFCFVLFVFSSVLFKLFGYFFFQQYMNHQGPYAWVHGRRATSKVTATSGGRLTNRYSWVPGRPTRRACLWVNLPLRVPPCKRYPEEVTELKMAALILLRYRQRRLLRRNRIFRNRTNPLHKFNDLELFWQFRFRRADILQMKNELKEELEHLNRKGALPPVFTGRRTALNLCQ